MSRHVKIFDTTLRDGEQSPGCSMNKEEKVMVARQLEKLGVDIIEAGFAIASKGDFESIQAISKAVSDPIICSLCRTLPKDIEAAAKSLTFAKKKRIHTFIATSPIHMEHKLKMTPEAVLEAAVNAVKIAKKHVDDVEFSCEDAGRSDPLFLVEVFGAVISAGATVINVPDTVGYKTPQEFGELIAYLKKNVPGIDTVDISVHCHDDLGLATANSLSGVLHGATQIECTINGIGERAGNTALEEVVMALKTRKDIYSAHTNIRTQEITHSSRLVSKVTGSMIQPNKAIVGANAFAHEAGIHQDGILKMRQTYEIMDATMIGLTENKLVLGKHSGRHAFSDRLKELGYSLDSKSMENAFESFKDLADKKKEIHDADLHAIITDKTDKTIAIYTLESLSVESGTKTQPKALVEISENGKITRKTGTGDGAVNAIYAAIDSIIGRNFKLEDYVIQAVTEGIDALAHVTVRIRENDRLFTGNGSSTDVLIASAKAYIMAINKLKNRYLPREKAGL
jgi:2-isopropylmalate synthase